MPLDEVTRAEGQVEELLDHLRAWLVAQPVWPNLMLGDRAARKRVAALIAHEVMTIPAARFEPGTPNRGLRKRIMRELAKADAEWWKGLEP